MHRLRLVFGPLLAAALVGLLILDEFIDGAAMPAGWRSALSWTGIRGGDTFPPGTIVFPVMLLLAYMASRELARMLREKSIEASVGVTTLCAFAGLLTVFAVPARWEGHRGAMIVALVAAVAVVGSLVYYLRRRNPLGVLAATGSAALAFVYLGLMFGHVGALRREHPVWVLLWVLAVTKSCDIGAYFTGRALGRHRMIPWLSPGKTWEGLAGGMTLAGLLAVGLAWVIERAGGGRIGPWWQTGLAGVLFAGVGQCGDLMVSVFKRDAGRKDSGHSLPGFGGVLDVMDSPILVAPVAYWWLAWGGAGN